jgi:hypothetical protein
MVADLGTSVPEVCEVVVVPFAEEPVVVVLDADVVVVLDELGVERRARTGRQSQRARGQGEQPQ